MELRRELDEVVVDLRIPDSEFWWATSNLTSCHSISTHDTALSTICSLLYKLTIYRIVIRVVDAFHLLQSHSIDMDLQYCAPYSKTPSNYDRTVND